MKWDDVRKAFPEQWVKILMLESHIENNILFIDDMAVVKSISDDLEATRELRDCRGQYIVYHTSHDTLEFAVMKNIGVMKGVR